MADKILEINPRTELASVKENNHNVDEIVNKISALELQIASLSERFSSSRTRSSSNSRARSRGRSRKRFDPNGKYCYYHFKFGKKYFLDKCKPSCNWKQPENFREQ
ncbi:hypothetical protein AVEN_26195-1 [Araneus ventricosus]|uniref:Uncharacterized protein n=1 Tax=Araneus ventricosus TaxID=182803 RepID=A0A4Y2QLU1_ARAVE|nr:hypothetical protein AVEN_225625-1 [Araneus ventricosus]GBN64315.1 hypothetical protein AVEN_26195-1 [Araneus ventricosus]